MFWLVIPYFFCNLCSLLNRFDERHDVDTALLIAVLVPGVLVKLASGVILLGWAFQDWHGNVNRMLLLKLLDAEQKRGEGDFRKEPTADTG